MVFTMIKLKGRAAWFSCPGSNERLSDNRLESREGVHFAFSGQGVWVNHILIIAEKGRDGKCC